MRERIYWNKDWEFTKEYREDLLQKDFAGEAKLVIQAEGLETIEVRFTIV